MTFQQARTARKNVPACDTQDSNPTGSNDSRLQRAKFNYVVVIESRRAAGRAKAIPAHLHLDQPRRMGWCGAIE